MILILTLAAEEAPPSPLSDVEFLVLLEGRQEIEPDEVAAALPRLTLAQQQHLNTLEQLGISLYTRACHSEASLGLSWRASSGTWDCERLLSLESEAASWGAGALLHGYAEIQRARLLTTVEPSSLAVW